MNKFIVLLTFLLGAITISQNTMANNESTLTGKVVAHGILPTGFVVTIQDLNTHRVLDTSKINTNGTFSFDDIKLNKDYSIFVYRHQSEKNILLAKTFFTFSSAPIVIYLPDTSFFIIHLLKGSNEIAGAQVILDGMQHGFTGHLQFTRSGTHVIEIQNTSCAKNEKVFWFGPMPKDYPEGLNLNCK